MILRALICAVGLLWSGMAVAQEIAVQSGDHDGFTRLVAAIGRDRDWDITRDGRTVQIAFDPVAPGFDVGSVFTLITRDRLADLRSDNGLMLELGCDCTVEVSRYQGRYAVIDISDTPYEAPASDPPPVIALPDMASATAQLPPPSLAPQVEPEPTPPAPRPTVDLEEAAAIMAEQLARAAAAGLLDAAPGEPFSTADPVAHAEPTDTPHPEQHETDPQDPPPVTHIPQPAEPPAASPPILAANAFDLNQGSWPDRLIASAPVSCLAAPRRPLSEWRGELSFLNELGAIRARLYDDRGGLQDSAALELAELYLVHGFGAEALFWLNETHNPPGFHLAMAQFLEFGADGQFGSFADQELCPEALTLWLFLTDPAGPRPSEELRQAILAQYFDLPIPLRDLIGPPLARAFVAANVPGAALEIRETLIRGGRLSPQDLAFLDADLPGVPPPPEATLAPANAGSTRTDQALTLRLFSQITEHGSARPEDLTAADALIRETTPPLTVGGLRHAAALGHALAGDIEATLTHLALDGQRDAEAIRPVFSDILTALMELERSAPLLLLLSSEEFGQFGYFPNPAFRRRVARYLLDHGLPGMARDLILAGGSDHARDREVLNLTYDRLAHDHSADTQPEALPQPERTPVSIAETPEAMATLLADSRSLRQQALAQLESQ